MICIIGGKCKDGIVLAADWKVISDDGSIGFKKKIFMDYYPVVVASSGYTIQLGNFRREVKEAAQSFLPQSVSDISGGFSTYPIEDEDRPTIMIYPYLDKLKEIVRKYKKESNRLVAIQTKDKGQAFIISMMTEYLWIRMSMS